MTRHLDATGKCASLFWIQLRINMDRMKSPRQLSREAIDEFKIIYEAEFGVPLSDDEAQEIALRLLRFFRMLTARKPDLDHP
jgi:hypothetical protein